MLKRIAFLAVTLAFVLAAAPAFAQSGEGFCALPEGCDLDGDGTPETPSGTPVPSEGQYDDGEICFLPEGCEPTVDPTEPDQSGEGQICLLPEGCDVDENGVPEVQSGAPVPVENTQKSAPSTVDSPISDNAAPTNEATSAGEAVGINVLPETGGAFSIMTVAGSLLVGGGLLIRRLAR